MSVFENYNQDPRGAPEDSVAVVHAQVREAILRGELAPGSELSQARLARHLGVSRTPLREALRMLISEGLLEGESHRQLRVAGFSIPDMEQLYMARVALEALCVRVSTPRLTDKDLAVMRDLLAQMAHFAGEQDYEAWEVPHRALHATFPQYAGARLVAIVTQLSEHAERYRRAYTTQAERAWEAGIAEHRRVVDACEAGDPDEAARALAEHLGHTALGVIELNDPSYGAVGLRTAIAAAAAASGTGGARGVA